MAAEFKIEGMKQLHDALTQLPVKLQKNVMRGALRTGAKIIEADARQRIPVGQPSAKNVRLYGGYEGALLDSLRVSAGIRRDGTVTASVKTGGKNKKGADVYYALWVEYGVSAHLIKPNVMHPGFPPIPFMRPAMDAKAYQAAHAVADYIRERFTKLGIETESKT